MRPSSGLNLLLLNNKAELAGEYILFMCPNSSAINFREKSFTANLIFDHLFRVAVLRDAQYESHVGHHHQRQCGRLVHFVGRPVQRRLH